MRNKLNYEQECQKVNKHNQTTISKYAIYVNTSTYYD